MVEQNDEQLAVLAMENGAYEEAVRLLRPLAERNWEYALLALGWIYDTGAAGPPDQNAARKYYDRAAGQGSAAAYLYLGKLLMREGNEAEARDAFERGAQLGNDDCKSELKELADDAEERLARTALRERAYEKAIHLLRPLAERDSTFALLSLGFIYETGVMGAPDWNAARLYYERAASLGSAAGYFELGRLLKRQGKERDARAAFQGGAVRGHLPSMSRLGTMMIEGSGGPYELEAGTAWLEKAAANGHVLARRKLLAIESRNATSVFEKIAVKMKIAKLALEGSKEMSKRPSSDRVR